MAEITSRYRITTYIGLFIVLVLVSVFWMPSVYKSLLSSDFELRNYQMQFFDWLIVLIIILLILYGERNSLTTLNLKKPTWEMLGIGMGLGGFSLLYIFLHRIVINAIFGATNFENQLDNPSLAEVGPEFIFVYGIFSLITASVAEEIIYRGYATERLMKLHNSYWLAFLLPLAAFHFDALPKRSRPYVNCIGSGRSNAVLLFEI